MKTMYDLVFEVYFWKEVSNLDNLFGMNMNCTAFITEEDDNKNLVSVIFFKMHFHIPNILCYPDCFSNPKITFFDFAFHPIHWICCCVTFFVLYKITTIFTWYRALLLEGSIIQRPLFLMAEIIIQSESMRVFGIILNLAWHK